MNTTPLGQPNIPGNQESDVLYSAHISNKCRVPVRVHTLFTTTPEGRGAQDSTTSTESEEVLQPGTETTFKERYYGRHDQVRMEIVKVFCESAAGRASHSEQQAPFGILNKTYADFEIVQDGLGNLQLNKHF